MKRWTARPEPQVVLDIAKCKTTAAQPAETSILKNNKLLEPNRAASPLTSVALRKLATTPQSWA